MSETMTLTREHVFAGRSKAGGWTRKQLALLGVSWPPRHGWIDRVAGREHDATKVREFLGLKNAHLAARSGKAGAGGPHPDGLADQESHLRAIANGR